MGAAFAPDDDFDYNDEDENEDKDGNISSNLPNLMLRDQSLVR